MKIYKVWAKCTKKAVPVKEISNKKANRCIGICAMNILDSIYKDDSIDIEDYYDSIVGFLTREFNQYKRLDCGDYCIIKADEEPTRPNMCGYPSVTHEDVIADLDFRKMARFEL